MASFQAFFSYAHHDEITNPKTIKCLSETLESEINARLINAKLSIWRDTNGLRIGDRWDDRIGEAINQSKIFIVLISPKWIESEYCRKEFEIFESIETEIGDYIAPILVRNVDRQAINLSGDQAKIYSRLKHRQYIPLSDPNVMSTRNKERNNILSKLSDDIEGMVERLRRLTETSNSETASQTISRKKTTPTFTAKAHNYADVDFVASAEVAIDRTPLAGSKGIYAHIDFLPRMYVQTNSARLEFAIRRAYLSIDDGGKNVIERNEDWLGRNRGNAYYVNMKNNCAAINICIEPQEGRDHLQELALPPATGENRFAKVGTVSGSASFTDFRAKLSVSMRAESLHVFSPNEQERPAPVSLRKVTAIINAMIAKEENSQDDFIERDIAVVERKGSA